MPLDVTKRGTLDRKDPPLKAIVADDETYEEGYHAGDVGGLSAVETDLAVGNIKKDENIFGKVGTYEGAAPTVTELIASVPPETKYTVAAGYVTIKSDTVPADAKVVIVWGCGSYQGDNTGTRCLYNGVEKFEVLSGGDTVGDSASFAGLGSAATIAIQCKSAQANHYIHSNCAVFYVT